MASTPLLPAPPPASLAGPAPRPAPLIAEIAALAPERLAERLSDLAGDLDRGYAVNTQRLWRASWRVWVAFCAATEQPVMPASVESLRAFLLARQAAGKRLATLEGNVATLAIAHRLFSQPWPLATLEGALMWRGIRRQLRAKQHQKDGLTIAHLERLLASLDPAVPRDARDAALLSLAYETQLRRSNVVALDLEHVSFDADGTATVFIEKSKEDQEGEGRVKALSADTTGRLCHWLALAGITGGALFRSTPHSNRPDRFVRRLTDRDLARIFKRRAAAAGLTIAIGPDKKRPADISGHSTRIGAAQDMVAAGYGEAEIVREVGWKDARRLYHYTQGMQAQRGPMARFLKRRALEAAASDEDADPD